MRWQALAVVFGIMLAVNAGRAAEGLVLRLPFDGDYNSTVGEGVAQPFNSPQFVEGKFGRAVKLEGSACLAHAVPDCVRQGEFTLSFWIKPLWDKDDGVAHPLLVIPNDPRKRDKIGWGPNEYLLSKGFSDVIAPDYLYGVANSVCAKQLKRGEWTHVMVGFSAKEKLRADYFNGRGGRSAWTPESLDCHGDQLWLGSRGDKFGGGDFVLGIKLV